MRSLFSLGAAALGAVGLCLLLLKAVAGGPFRSEQLADPILLANLDAAYGLTTPWWVQWAHWCLGAAHGSLGTSFQHRGVEVTSLLADAWPTSLVLGSSAMVLGLLLAVPAAVLVARARLVAASSPGRSTAASTVRKFAIGTVELGMGALLCLPTYVSAPLVLGLGIWLSQLVPTWDEPSRAVQLAQATLVLALPVASVAYHWVLLGLGEAAASPWWIAVRARGLSERRRWWRYALPWVWPSLAGRLSPLAAELLTGSLVVEAVFGLPGLGHLLGSAALHRDAPVLMGAVACAVITVRGTQAVAELLGTCTRRTTAIGARA